ncbi:MAG: NAD(P)/FAD-dependent oxidoreductase [Aminipila sp.]
MYDIMIDTSFLCKAAGIYGLINEKKFLGRGVSYSATYDGILYTDKFAAVVGSGKTALKEAALLSDYCKRVYIINEQKSSKEQSLLIRELEKKRNIEFIFNATIAKLEGEDILERAIIENKEVGWFRNIEISRLFIESGQTNSIKGNVKEVVE